MTFTWPLCLNFTKHTHPSVISQIHVRSPSPILWLMSWSWLLALWCWDNFSSHGRCLEYLGWSLTVEGEIWGATVV